MPRMPTKRAGGKEKAHTHACTHKQKSSIHTHACIAAQHRVSKSCIPASSPLIPGCIASPHARPARGLGARSLLTHMAAAALSPEASCVRARHCSRRGGMASCAVMHAVHARTLSAIARIARRDVKTALLQPSTATSERKPKGDVLRQASLTQGGTVTRLKHGCTLASVGTSLITHSAPQKASAPYPHVQHHFRRRLFGPHWHQSGDLRRQRCPQVRSQPSAVCSAVVHPGTGVHESSAHIDT